MAVDIAQLLAFAVKNNASDLHLSAGVPPMIRVDGDRCKSEFLVGNPHRAIGADVTGAYNRDFLSQDRLLLNRGDYSPIITWRRCGTGNAQVYAKAPRLTSASTSDTIWAGRTQGLRFSALTSASQRLRGE